MSSPDQKQPSANGQRLGRSRQQLASGRPADSESLSVSVKTGAPADGIKKDGVPEESGGPSGPEPTRYGDWERKGRCIDF